MSPVQPEFADPRSIGKIVASGGRVELNCSTRAHVYPPATLEWMKRDISGVIRLGVQERYSVSQARLEDSGEYICIATNKYAWAFATKSIFLKVYGK